MDRQRFETAIQTAMARLPERFRNALHNIAIVIEDRPRRDRALLGLYEGTPLPDRLHDFAGMPPDKITLFKAHLEAACRTEVEVIEEIRITLCHEIGHYFGMTEEQLQRMGY